MIFGEFSYDNISVHARGKTYRIDGISVFSVSRPFLPMGLVIAAGTGSFLAANYDLLWPAEQFVIGAICAAATACGWTLGQLQFLSRDLRGSQLMTVIYGSYGHLNRLRRDIVAAKSGPKPEEAA